MPNVKGGKGYKKGKKGKGKTGGKKNVTPWASDSPGLVYAQVKKKLGGNRLDVECTDEVKRQAIIPGSFLRRVWINANDIVLLQVNDLNPKEGFILYKYNIDECHQLKTKGDLNFDISSLQADTGEILFGDEEDFESSDELDEDELQDEVNRAQQETTDKKELAKHERRAKDKDSDMKKNKERDKKFASMDDSEVVNIDDI